MADEQNVNVFDGLDDEGKNFIETKGFKSVADVVNGYRNLEKFQGVPSDKLLKIPDDNAEQNVVDEFYSKLGRPKTAQEYKFDVGEGQDDKLAKAIAPELFKAGLSQKQASALYKALETAKIAEAQALEKAQAQQEQELKTEWGNNYDTNLKVAQAAFRICGVSQEQVEALQKSTDFKTVMNLFKNIGSKFSEATLKGAFGDTSSGSKFTLSKQEAQNKIEELKSNKEWVDKLNNGDKAVLEEYRKLAEIAY